MRFHSRDLRKGRYSQPGGIYLLTWITNDRIPWFSDWTLGRIVVSVMRMIHERNDVESLAFVIMPDHAHWLISLGNSSLSAVMRNTKSRSGYYLKQAICNRGQSLKEAIWQQGFHDHALRVEESLPDVARYIVMNPVRAGLVKTVRQYPLWDAKWL
jgi:putative transposase